VQTTKAPLKKDTFIAAWSLMTTARALTDTYENNFKEVSKYVHATSKGHEAVQIALGLLLNGHDFVAPYYRDDAMLLAIGMQPFELMLQLMAKRDDPFSGGRSYYSHPSLRREGMPKIPHQSSATGMQAIPATGVAMGLKYRESTGMSFDKGAISVCSLGDASVTEGEISEAFHMSVLKQLPMLYLVQDNEWDISAYKEEFRISDAFEYAKGFPGLEAVQVDGTDFETSYLTLQRVINTIRTERRPFLVHATVPLLNHHTSGVRKEWYRHDLDEQSKRDPLPKLFQAAIDNGIAAEKLEVLRQKSMDLVLADFEKARKSPNPEPADLFDHDFAPTPIIEERGTRVPAGAEPKVMVDCALLAVEELLRAHPEALLYGQDVGARLGGVFREAATLAQKFGNDRVFNTPIQEAFIVGSTVGMSAAGLKPIVEVQFADYIWPGLNQLFTEVSRSCYLSNGKWPVSMVLRVPIGAYGSGGPYHSSSVESVLTNIRGIKIAYPSNGADLKGLMKAAYYDPNPVVILEHKGLYWSKVPGTDAARSAEPSEDYVLPLGKAAITHRAETNPKTNQLVVITYGMGVHWALNAIKGIEDQVSIVDLRTLFPLDMSLIINEVQRHHRCLVVTEEPVNNTFAQSIAARVSEACWQQLDAPVRTIGAENLPAIPLNSVLEATMLLSADKVRVAIDGLLGY
jgi:2-oxoisovalerate dehydrogenase E1 component